MDESSFVIWLAVRVAAVAVGLFMLDRLGLWLEARGWLYYRHKKPKPGGVTSAALEAERLMGRPGIEYHVAAQDARLESEENDGE